MISSGLATIVCQHCFNSSSSDLDRCAFCGEDFPNKAARPQPIVVPLEPKKIHSIDIDSFKESIKHAVEPEKIAEARDKLKGAWSFSGRLSPSGYWQEMPTALKRALGVTLGVTLVGLIQSGGHGELVATAPVMFLMFFVIVLIPATVRRLHDTGRSGFWFLMAIVPVIGIIGLIIMVALPGESKLNKFGPPSV